MVLVVFALKEELYAPLEHPGVHPMVLVVFVLKQELYTSLEHTGVHPIDLVVFVLKQELYTSLEHTGVHPMVLVVKTQSLVFCVVFYGLMLEYMSVVVRSLSNPSFPMCLPIILWYLSFS